MEYRFRHAGLGAIADRTGFLTLFFNKLILSRH